MKLGSLKEGGRDGTLVVVSRDLSRAVRATGIAPTLQRALEDWDSAAPRLNALYDSLNEGDADGVFDLEMASLASPLPRAYEFVDGSAYLPHVERVRRARGAEVPESFYVDPLMYQAVSAGFLGPRDPVKVVSEDYGIDLEAEIVIVTGDVPMAVTPEQAAAHIQLVGRHRIKGGETRIFEADGPQGLRFTLEAPWSLMLMDDPRVIHESTPIQPLDDAGGHRDTLVLTFRANAFLGDDTG